jgi:hypothetical protein
MAHDFKLAGDQIHADGQYLYGFVLEAIASIDMAIISNQSNCEIISQSSRKNSIFSFFSQLKESFLSGKN